LNTTSIIELPLPELGGKHDAMQRRLLWSGAAGGSWFGDGGERAPAAQFPHHVVHQ
jgi:hypothetical protein